MKTAFATRAFAILAFALTVMGCSVEAENASSLKSPDEWRTEFEIQNWASNGCLDIEGMDNSNGARVHMWGCTNNWNQRWHFINQGDGTFLIQSAGGRCLDVSNGDSGDGARIQIWDCAGGHPNQSFWLDHITENGYHLVNKGTNKPLIQYGGDVGQRGDRSGGDVIWRKNQK